MSQLTLAHPENLVAGAKATATAHGELLGHISQLQSNQQEWQNALGGQTGTQTQNAVQNAISSAQRLANYLDQNILTPLRDAHVKFDQAAQDSANMVGKGTAFADDSSNSSYTAGNTSFSKVDTSF
ncbi:hypothetical protein [Nocardia miyunensis]|uniref:hypothetical protein n=1 Tax=Nocardia miyunensis TaxID=282684 RepID=UPI000830F386|nr:hypothetical protein [Nocardia miyunensis]